MVKRRRVASTSEVSYDQARTNNFPGDPLSSATIHDTRNWKGFCEIESEPVRIYFIRGPRHKNHSDVNSRPSSTFYSRISVYPTSKYRRLCLWNKNSLIRCRLFTTLYLKIHQAHSDRRIQKACIWSDIFVQMERGQPR